MPIKDGKYKNPNWVNGGPPAIDADELNAISSTLESLDAAGGTGGDGKRYARIVIGTSTNGWTAADCDYLCDGVDDQVEINQAIADFGELPVESWSYGTIVLLDGTYHLTAPLSALTKINLVGTGGTVLVRETPTGESGYNYMILVQFAKIENIRYQVADSVTFPNESETIEIVLGGNSEIRDCAIQDFRSTGIGIYSGTWAGNVIVSNNFFWSGLGAFEDAIDIHVLYAQSFIIENNNIDRGILVSSSSPSSSVASSFSVSNNLANGVLTGKIVIDGLGGGTITGNKCGQIQILNTKNFQIFVGNIVSNNLLSSGVDDAVLILLGENTHDNIVVLNGLKYYNTTGRIQDNGTNNIINNGFTGGQVILTTSGWSANTQTVTAPGVTVSNYVTTGPTPTAFNAAMEAGVYCSGQGNGTLTFTCTKTPSGSITYTYTAQEVL